MSDQRLHEVITQRCSDEDTITLTMWTKLDAVYVGLTFKDKGGSWSTGKAVAVDELNALKCNGLAAVLSELLDRRDGYRRSVNLQPGD